MHKYSNMYSNICEYYIRIYSQKQALNVILTSITIIETSLRRCFCYDCCCSTNEKVLIGDFLPLKDETFSKLLNILAPISSLYRNFSQLTAVVTERRRVEMLSVYSSTLKEFSDSRRSGK